MSKNNDLTPVALYARVSSDRQDVDLSVAAQLRGIEGLRRQERLPGGPRVRGRGRERQGSLTAPSSGRCSTKPAKPERLFTRFWSGNSLASPASGSTPWPSSPCCVARASAWSPSPSTPTTPPPASLMEAIIESVDEFYSENLAQEVTRGMREAASRGFWMNASAPYGYRRVYVQDGIKKRPRLELNPPHDAVVRRIFDLTLQGPDLPGHPQDPQRRGHPLPQGQAVAQDHRPQGADQRSLLRHFGLGPEGERRSGAGPRGKRLPAIVSTEEFDRARRLMEARAPKVTHPRRAASPYLLSGLAKCESCGKASPPPKPRVASTPTTSASPCSSRAAGPATLPRLNAKNFEDIIVSNIRENILTESNVRDLVRLVDEEMDGVAREQRQNLDTIEAELEEVKRKLDRIWHFVESTDLDMADASERILEHRHRREQLEAAAEDARAVLSQRRGIAGQR